MLEIEVMRHRNDNDEKTNVTLEAIACESGNYPKSISRHELERSLNESFATRSKKVLSGFFYEPQSEAYPGNLSLVVIAHNKNTDQIAGGTIVETYSVDDGNGGSVKINYISKVWVLPEYERNGLMRHLLELTDESANKKIPSVLRTSDSGLDCKYAPWSDMGAEVPNYWIRGRGFLTRNDKKEKFPNSKYWMHVIAKHLDEKPASVVSLEHPKPAEYAPSQPNIY